VSYNKKLFNLDLHIAVVQEIRMGLSQTSLKMRTWNMSLHNHLVRNFFKFPDPVRFISAKNWRHMDKSQVDAFQKYYGRMLNRYQAFVISYPPSFVELFISFNKPILVICPTRYEIPYTDNEVRWEQLNTTLRQGVETGQVTICVNSLAEQKYLEYYSGITAEVIPTVCDYLTHSWKGTGSTPVFFSKSQKYSSQIMEATSGLWQAAEKELGANYTWESLMAVPAIFVLPYNNNTMRMFEFAHAGIPVFVPSKKFLRNLYRNGEEGVMSEVSNYRVFGIDASQLDSNDPSNYLSDTFIDYWINISDFYNAQVMQNIYFIDSFEELLKFHEYIDKPELELATLARNKNLRNMRNEFFVQFERKIYNEQ
jgi:hypothetical protein